VRRVDADRVWINVGFKSEGSVALAEWFDGRHGHPAPPRPGDEVEALLESLEGDDGSVSLSLRKAQRRRAFEGFVDAHAGNVPVVGFVTRRVKGGLLVDLGTDAFLPASEVDVRSPTDLSAYVGQSVECLVLDVDRARQRVTLSRRALLERRRERMRAE